MIETHTERQPRSENKETRPNERTGEDSEKELNEMEASNLPYAEFKTLLITTLSALRGRVDELSENFNKETVSIEKGHTNHKPVRKEEYNNRNEDYTRRNQQ